MAQTVIVQTTASGSGAPVAVESIGTFGDVQLIKLLAGQTSGTAPIEGTTGVPDASSMGLIVALKAGPSVTAQVSGTVSVSGTVPVSGTVTVAGSVVVSGSAQVSGTVSVVGISATTAAPSTSATGQIVWLAGGQGASANVVHVSGTVNIGAFPSVDTTADPVAGHTALVVRLAGSAAVSGTVSVVGNSTVVSGTVTVGNFTTVVSGTVSAILPGSTTAASGVSGALVWLGASQSVIVSTQISGTVTVNGTVTVATGTVTVANFTTVASGTVTAILPGSTTGSSGMSGVLVWLGASQSVLISTQVSGTVTVNGTVTAVVSGTVTVGGLASTTAAPSVSAVGQVVWLAGGQGTTVSPVVVTGTVSAGAGTTVISGTVSVANLTSVVSGTVSLANQTTVVSGTVTVGNLSVSTTGSSGMSGLLVWLGASQTVLISTEVSGTVNVPQLSLTTAAPSTSATGVVVWQANPAVNVTVAVTNISTVNTLLGTVNVAIVAGAGGGGSVTTAGPNVTATGQVMWVAGGQSAQTNPVWISGTAAVTGTIALNNFSTQVSGTVTAILPGSTTATSGVSGIFVWLGASQSVLVSTQVSGTVTVNGSVNMSGTGTVYALDVGRTNVMFTVTMTSVGISGTTMAFGVYVGLSAAVSGTTTWVVPSGKTFRLLAVNLLARNSVTTSPVEVHFVVIGSTAAPTWTSATPIIAQIAVGAVSVGIGVSGCAVGVADVPAGATIAIAHTIGTSGATIVHGQVNGYLFP